MTGVEGISTDLVALVITVAVVLIVVFSVWKAHRSRGGDSDFGGSGWFGGSDSDGDGGGSGGGDGGGD